MNSSAPGAQWLKCPLAWLDSGFETGKGNNLRITELNMSVGAGNMQERQLASGLTSDDELCAGNTATVGTEHTGGGANRSQVREEEKTTYFVRRGGGAGKQS